MVVGEKCKWGGRETHQGGGVGSLGVVIFNIIEMRFKMKSGQPLSVVSRRQSKHRFKSARTLTRGFWNMNLIVSGT